MAGYDFVSCLHEDRTDWVIKVKIVRKWFDKVAGRRRLLEFLLMDEQGEYIQAYVYHRQKIVLCDRTIREGQWKRMSNFVVFDDVREHLNTGNGYAIKICENTDILNVDPVEIDEGIGFERFEEILGEDLDLIFPTNTLGFVVAIDNLRTVDDERSREKTALLTFTLKDDKGLILRCSALGPLAVDINDRICNVPDMAVLCSLTHWSVDNDGGGRYLKSRGGILRLEVYPDFLEAIEYSRRFWVNHRPGISTPEYGSPSDAS